MRHVSGLTSLVAVIWASTAAVPGSPIAAPAHAALAATAGSVAPAESPRPAMPWVAILRAECASTGRAPIARTIAARLGAALAWDLADLPRHQIGATQPWGVFRSSPDFVATTGSLAPGDGGAIGVCITRWNTLYPPYALTAMDDVDRPVRQVNDPSEEPSCPVN